MPELEITKLSEADQEIARRDAIDWFNTCEIRHYPDVAALDITCYKEKIVDASDHNPEARKLMESTFFAISLLIGNDSAARYFSPQMGPKGDCFEGSLVGNTMAIDGGTESPATILLNLLKANGIEVDIVSKQTESSVTTAVIKNTPEATKQH